MNGFQIKVVACMLMLFDHMGVILFPENVFLRVIGRLAFPLFAWLLATGFYHTRNVFRYLRRLFLFALVVQIPYFIYFRDYHLNIFFTLFLGLGSIYLYQRTTKRAEGLLTVLLVLVFSEIIHADYGFYGVLTIFLFYFYYYDFKKIVISQVILNLIDLGHSALTAMLNHYSLGFIDMVQPFSLLSLIFIYIYNGNRGKNFKYAFYLFYPLHLILLYGIKIMTIK